jgi:Ca2+-binding EF-hand superfamily protein
MEVRVAFEKADKEKKAERGAATIDVKTLIPELKMAAKPSADRAVISLGNTRLVLSAHNLVAAMNDKQGMSQSAQQNQIHLMVHDQGDALFEALDINADGRLGEREIAYCPKRLAEQDRNGDGQLSGDEFPYSLIVAFLLGEQPSAQNFYVPPSAAIAVSSKEQKPAEWFARADLNGDGDISRREFLGTSAQFDRLDSDKDGYVSPHEAEAERSGG